MNSLFNQLKSAINNVRSPRAGDKRLENSFSQESWNLGNMGSIYNNRPLAKNLSFIENSNS